MSNSDLILRLIEMLLAERNENNKMKVELDKTKEKAKLITYIIKSRKETTFPTF